METYSDGERVQRNTYIRWETRIRKEEGTRLQNVTDITNYFYQEGSVLYTADNDNETKSFNLLNISDIFGTERAIGSVDSYYFYFDDSAFPSSLAQSDNKLISILQDGMMDRAYLDTSWMHYGTANRTVMSIRNSFKSHDLLVTGYLDVCDPDICIF